MRSRFDFGSRLSELVNRIVESYLADDKTHHIDKRFLPSRRSIIHATEMLIELAYPGYWGRQHLTRHNVPFHVGELVPRIGEVLHRETFNSFCYRDEMAGITGVGGESYRRLAYDKITAFMEEIPTIRGRLSGDVQAAYDGDPAATDTAETILCYPGVLAVTVYRFANELHNLEVPWVPRVMSEWAHSQTGIDIHPGATIGENFFIDHGTGVVIGETAEIGDNVKMYQGVTLGALSFPKDERGRIIRGYKRHPTVEDNATLYANAIVLGGQTVIGSSSVVGGSVFLTSSIPNECTVTIKTPELSIRKGRREKKEVTTVEPFCLDYQI